MKFLYNALSIAMFAILISSCKKDNNDYNYKPLNVLKVTTDGTTFVAEQLDTLRIKPAITESMSGNGPYTYEWIMYKTKDLASWEITASSPANKAIKLSSEKDLEAAMAVQPGVYTLQFTITDTKTKLKTFNKYTVTINGKYYDGWLVMSNKNGKATLSFIRKDDTIFPDVIAPANNGMQLAGKGLAAFSAIQAQMEDVNVFTDQEVYRFSANDFSFTGKSDNLFETKVIPTSTPNYAVNYFNFDQYIVIDGGIYGALTPINGLSKYSERFNGPDYSVFPYFMSGSKYYTLYYDNKNKRFLQNTYNTRSLLAFPSIPDGAYDVSNVGKTAIAIDKGPNTEYFLVMKDNAGYYLCSILPNNQKPAGLMQTMNAIPDIANATAFAASETNKQLYYAAGNKIYIYDILANSAKLAYQFPANTNVKDIQMFKSKGWGKTDDMFNKRLVVATYNGTEGEIYYLDLLPIGDVANGTYSKKFGGFGDIVQINYRNPNL